MTDHPRQFGPMPVDHPAVMRAEKCPGCSEPIQEGDYVTLVVIGPGTDQDAQARARRGRAYNAVSVIAHYPCVTGYPKDPSP